ncbi:SNW domain-containing protein 1-like [Oppia nitens]|uniref:SNW domain-containing protein 1-like n=1 Tax=Oppia nitens TaxID=1686743 RepID=UPI0023D99466|nr:SNW domain-containing protein 1-like [Oppia nitens]
MSSFLSTSLPPPKHVTSQSRPVAVAVTSSAVATCDSRIPPYGSRSGWIPRCQLDFGSDGGAFPEIPIAQFPLDMGRKVDVTSNALSVELDSRGEIKFDALLRQGASIQDKVIYHKLQDLLPQEVRDDSVLEKPDEEFINKTTEETRLALQRLTQTKISAALPVRHADKTGSAQYIRYTPSGSGADFGSGSEQRIIRLVEVQRDPLEPPKFKINQKIPQAPPSPPPPVMHSPTRKVSVREQQEWRIPPCISNWKNAKGYTIPLDKRLAADGRGLQQTHINENFAKLSEALYVADRKAREAVEMRAQMERKLAQKEKEKKEDHLRALAQRAREERAGIRAESPDGTHDERERHNIRHERHKDRQRERNLQRAAPDKRSRLERQRERDISEQIALGVANPRSGQSEVQFDSRLFNQSKGLSSGFAEEDDYGVYDKPWRSNQVVSQTLYRPSKTANEDLLTNDDIDALANTQRFVPDKEFSGTDRNARRDGPVQFEKQEEEDPFGLDKFLTEVKKSSKRTEESSMDPKNSHKRRKD